MLPFFISFVFFGFKLSMESLFVFCWMQVFNTDGEFLLKFGSNGEGNGQFNAPTGVAVDVNGNIIVADWGNSRIQVSIEVSTYVLACSLFSDKIIII